MSIGFCFLVKDDVHQIDLWNRYFANSGKRAKIFVHRALSWSGKGDKKLLQACAMEGDSCLCLGGDVYFVKGLGKVGQFSKIKAAKNVKKRVSISIACTNEAFGSDPSPGWRKSCYCDMSARLRGQGGEINFSPWRGQQDKSNDNTHLSALVRDHMLPVKEHVFTKWGDISLVRAVKVLFRRCYESGAVKCVLLSDSDVPIRPFDEAYAYLTAHSKSHLDYASVPANNEGERWTQVMMLSRFVNNIKRDADFAFNIDVRHFTYHSMWLVLNREHTKIFVDDNAIFKHFETGKRARGKSTSAWIVCVERTRMVKQISMDSVYGTSKNGQPDQHA